MLCDSGVWLSSLDQDDRYHEASSRLIDGSAASGRSLGALDLTLYEVANVAAVSWRSADDAATAVELVRRSTAGTIIPWNSQMLGLAVDLTAQHRLSVYDAAYVATAQALGWTLVSTGLKDLVKPGFAVAPDQVVV
jgi:predicted nucleic acid-binding protein